MAERDPNETNVMRIALAMKSYTTAAYGEHSTAEKLVRDGWLTRVGTVKVGNYTYMKYLPTQKAREEFFIDQHTKPATKPLRGEK